MTKTVLGKINGRTIELDQDLGIAAGEMVEVQVRSIDSKSPTAAKWGEGILRSAGGWKDYPEMDAIMAKIQEERKLERRAQAESE